jgi:Uma2 family endonuclease
MVYLDGDLQLVTRGFAHERGKTQLSRLVEAYMLEARIDFTTTGEVTLRSKVKRAGLEPDESYILTGEPDRRRSIDLAIEVVVTSGGLDKLEVYRRLGTKEVWILKGGAITVHVLRRAQYELVPRSSWLPELDLELIAQFVDLTPTSGAIRAYLAALRATK